MYYQKRHTPGKSSCATNQENQLVFSEMPVHFVSKGVYFAPWLIQDSNLQAFGAPAATFQQLGS